jgi:glutamate-1-semialdehyde 2,1-aminomutase
VPGPVRALYDAIPFNDAERARAAIRRTGDELAAVVIEPVVEGPPSREWLDVLAMETGAVGAILVFDEIKTGFRVGLGGAVERWGVVPDLVVLGKALANGFPLSAVGGRADLVGLVDRTWISSTLATEFVALAAARAAVDFARTARVPEWLGVLGARLFTGLGAIAAPVADLVTARGIPEMCYLDFRDPDLGGQVAAGCARRGLLLKRNAYNFVSFAHDEASVDRCLDIAGEVVVAAIR